MKSVLLYNLCPLNNWKEVTEQLLTKVSHDEIFINISFPLWKYLGFGKKEILEYLTKFTKSENIFCSLNRRKLGEVVGFEKFRKEIDFSDFEIATYIHSKGVSKRKYKNLNVRDWTMMMHYFVVERHDLCIEAFKKGNALYGCNLILQENMEPNAPNLLRKTPFVFAGNFVSINLNLLRNLFLKTVCDSDYFGVECFWGKLTSKEKAFVAHQAKILNHYEERYLPERYKQV